MYCEKCGAGNSETAVFCRKCGVAMNSTGAEVETHVAARVGHATSETQRSGGDDQSVREARPPVLRMEENSEAEIFTISPTLKFVKAGYIVAAIAAVLFVAFVSAVFASYVSVGVAVVLGLMLFLIPGYYHFRQKFVSYTLTESKLEIDSGFVSRTTLNVPIRRIQDVTIAVSPWQRLLAIGDLVIDNASETGGKTILKNIDTPKRYADELLEQMRRLER